MRGGNPISRNEPILPAIRENMPKSRTDVFQVYELRRGGRELINQLYFDNNLEILLKF